MHFACTSSTCACTTPHGKGVDDNETDFTREGGARAYPAADCTAPMLKQSAHREGVEVVNSLVLPDLCDQRRQHHSPPAAGLLPQLRQCLHVSQSPVKHTLACTHFLSLCTNAGGMHCLNAETSAQHVLASPCDMFSNCLQEMHNAFMAIECIQGCCQKRGSKKQHANMLTVKVPACMEPRMSRPHARDSRDGR